MKINNNLKETKIIFNDLVIKNLLECKDLYVVLENRFKKKYIEQYKLNNVFLKDSIFWAKFGNVHSASGHPDIDNRQSLSYAYSNFFDLVCCFGLDQKVCRYYSSFAYDSIKFITKGSYSRVWSTRHGGDIKSIHEYVANAHNFKVIIKSLDGCIYILPVHTLEVFNKYDGFNLYTEFDGYPESMRDFNNLSILSDNMNLKLKALDKEGYPSLNFMNDINIFSTHFVFDSEILTHKYSGVDSLNFSHVPFEFIELWVSDN